MTFPFGLEGSDVDDDAAAGVGAFAKAHGKDVTRDAKVFHAARQRKGVGWHDTFIGGDVHKRILRKALGIDDGVEDIGEHLKFVRHAQIVAVAGDAVADHAAAVLGGAHLTVGKRLNHALLLRHLANPLIRMYTHESAQNTVRWRECKIKRPPVY